MKTKLFAAIMTVAMLAMISMPVYAWNYGNPATPADNREEYFGPRADKLLIPLYPSQTSEWDAGLTLGKIDVTDWPLDDTHYTLYTTTYNSSIMVTPYGPEFGMRLFDLNQNNNTYLGNPPNPAYPQPTDVYFAGGYGNPMAELSLRTAVAYLSDRTKYVQNCGTVTNIPVYTVLGANDLGTSPWWKYTDWDITALGSRSDLCYLYNVTAASAVLNASGNFPLLPGHTWRQYTPDPAHLAPIDFQLIFYVLNTDPCRQYAGDELTAQLEQSGIQINVKKIYCGITGAHFYVMGAKDFHLYTGGWSLDAVPDYLILWDWAYYWHPGRPYDYAGCNDPTANAAAESCYSANTQADAVYWSIQFQVAFAQAVLAVPLWMAAGCKADYRTYTGGTAGVPVTPDDGENQYRGKYWTGFVNIAGGGTDNYFSFLNMHPEGVDYGNGSMTIRYGFATSSLSQLNPVYTESTWDNTVLDLIGYESLLIRNPYNLGEFDPWTVRTFSLSTYNNPVLGACSKVVFTLRDDIFWQDGTPVTIADIEFTFVELKNILASRGLAPPWWIGNVQDILDFSILDPYNFEVLFDVKSVFALGWAGLNRILPKHVWYPIVSSGDPTSFAPDPNLIGSGPWRLAEYVSGSHVSLVANKPFSIVQTTGDPGLAGSVPENSTMGYFRYLPIDVYDEIVSPASLAYMHKLPMEPTAATPLTLNTTYDNLFADRNVNVYSTVALNGTPVAIPTPYWSLPHNGNYGYAGEGYGFGLNGPFELQQGFSYWQYNGTHLEHYKYLFFETEDLCQVIWNGQVIAQLPPEKWYWARLHDEFGPIPTLSIQTGRPFHYDLEWYKCTISEDIVGSTWYDDMSKIVNPDTGQPIFAGLAAYPYKTELPTPDGIVWESDRITAENAFGSYPGSSKWNSLADINHDYKVTVIDISRILFKFGTLNEEDWSFSGPPDIAITNVTVSKAVVCQGYSASVSVTVANLGASSATSDVDIRFGSNNVKTCSISLDSGNSTTVVFDLVPQSFLFAQTGRSSIPLNVTQPPGSFTINGNGTYLKAQNGYVSGYLQPTPGGIIELYYSNGTRLMRWELPLLELTAGTYGNGLYAIGAFNGTGMACFVDDKGETGELSIAGSRPVNSVQIAGSNVTVTTENEVILLTRYFMDFTIPKGNYTVGAYAEPAIGETNTANNNFTDGWVIVSMVGDVTGQSGVPDGQVNLMDVYKVAMQFSTSAPTWDPYWGPVCDINNDGTVNLIDYYRVCMCFGQTDP